MKPRYQKLLDVFHLGMLLLVCCTLTTLLYQYTKQTDFLRQFTFYVILLIFSYLINRYIRKHIFIFLLPHFTLWILLCFLPIPVLDKFLCIILWTFLTGFDVFFWCNNTRSKVIVMPLPIAFAYPVIYWYLGRNSFGNYQAYSYYFGILYLVLALLCSYLKNTKYIEPIKEDSGYTPTKEILESNNRIVFGIGGLLLFGTLLLRYYPIETFLSRTFTLIKQGLIALLSFISRLMKSTPAIPEAEDIKLADMPQEPLPQGTTNPLFTLLQDVIIFIVYFLLVVGFFIAATMIIYRFIKKYLHHHAETTTTGDNDFSVIITKERLIKNKSKKATVDINKNNNQKIRHYYKKKITRFVNNKSFDPSQTPNERAYSSNLSSENGLTELTAYYNRARYSSETMTKEEVKEAKTYL